MNTINHPMIVADAVEDRSYQARIAEAAVKRSSLVVLPTGLGKTVVALRVIAELLSQDSKCKILFLAPTKPLVIQHVKFLEGFLKINEIAWCTGEITPQKRKKIWDDGRIIVSTPQVIENDLINHRYELSDVKLVVFDEVHRAVGNYAYVFIGEYYHKQSPEGLSLGMTASPGNDIEKILSVCKTVGIEHIEIRTKQDPDVKPYVHDMHLNWKEVELPPEYLGAIRLMQQALSERLQRLKDIGIIESAALVKVNRRTLLDWQKRIQMAIRSDPNPNKELFLAASTQNAALKLYHAIELLQTQGRTAFLKYFDRLRRDALSPSGSKASREVMNDERVNDVIARVKQFSIQHPKIPELLRIVNQKLDAKSDARIIVFTNYRATASFVLEALKNIQNARPIRFVGQAKTEDDVGLSQKEQLDVIQRFRSGEYNILIATSVAEEGLDIPSTDLVVFYEPVPSEIRLIQRRGRTARRMPGTVVVLIAKDTPDQGYFWASKRREKQMIRELEMLRSALSRRLGRNQQLPTSKDLLYEPKSHQSQLPASSNENKENKSEAPDKIIVDHRESRSGVVRRLALKGLSVQSQQLEVGDYVVSSRIGVERKEVDDFIGSLLEGKLFLQLRQLRDAYARPVLILEGDELPSRRNVNQNAVYGALVSIIVDYGVAVIQTRSSEETADVLAVMAKREQSRGEKVVAIRGSKPVMSLEEHQRFMVEGLPGVSAVLARRLLEHFGSIYALMHASLEELCEVQGVGKNTATGILDLIHHEFERKEKVEQ